jgi:hypothetical protein
MIYVMLLCGDLQSVTASAITFHSNVTLDLKEELL